MNKKTRLFIIITCIAIFLAFFASGCASSSNEGDKFIMGGTYRLNEKETINGNLSIFGGAVSLEKGSTINGNVTLIGGTVNAAGTINGGVNGLGGSITLGDSAVVKGDVTTLGATVNKSDSAVIQGKIVSQSENGVQIPDVPRVVAPIIVKPFADAMGILLRTLVIALLAVLVVLFLPRQTANIGTAIMESPLSAGAIGLLTVILFPFVIVILAITIILIPLSLVAVLIIAVGLILGWIAIGLELGNRIAGLFKGDWAPAVSAGVGTLILSLLSALLGAIPCVGWVVPTIL
ncbi:MAG TPA: polymer-forming cytoskeletal protein, partial [Leptolinea sp.]